MSQVILLPYIKQVGLDACIYVTCRPMLINKTNVNPICYIKQLMFINI
jgi:hypothetical protein